MIGDGDIAAAIAPSLPEADVDLYMGIGGAPESSAGAVRSNASWRYAMQMWHADEKERKNLIARRL